MRMEIGLSQVQVQKQILSPQMIQSMEILVLNSQQLEERIRVGPGGGIRSSFITVGSSGRGRSRPCQQ